MRTSEGRRGLFCKGQVLCSPSPRALSRLGCGYLPFLCVLSLEWSWECRDMLGIARQFVKTLHVHETTFI